MRLPGKAWHMDRESKASCASTQGDRGDGGLGARVGNLLAGAGRWDDFASTADTSWEASLGRWFAEEERATAIALVLSGRAFGRQVPRVAGLMPPGLPRSPTAEAPPTGNPARVACRSIEP